MAKEIERQYVVNTDHPEWEKLKATLPKKRYVQSTIPVSYTHLRAHET